MVGFLYGHLTSIITFQTTFRTWPNPGCAP
jgi:hypothetical protein